MRLVFYSNYLNIHQVYLMDEFHELLGDDFRFVATLPRNDNELKGGTDYSTRPYCILAGESDTAYEEALLLVREAETCVFGACSQIYAVERAKNNPKGLSFEVGERWLKRGWVNVFSPNLIKWYINYMLYYRKANFYKLCMSAFAAQDDEKLFAYRARHYKWGYFTKVEENYVETSESDVSTKGKVHILWCARFLLLKHPELVIKLAARLKEDGYNFGIDMYGEGEELERTKKLCDSLNVSDVITFKGNVPNKEILQAMRQHDIFLFTSDRHEGWGAVLNEAMNNCCTAVVSDAIGSAPYLIKDGINGMLFQSGKTDSLYEKVVYLLKHPNFRKQMAERGYKDILRLWNPQNAAVNLLGLIIDLYEGRETTITEGPCSKA